MNKSRNSNIIIITLIIASLLMAIGFATFATQLTVDGTVEIVGEWNVKITNIEAIQVSSGCDSGTPEFTDTSVTFNAKLLKPGDIITYRVTIQNAGTINAVLEYAIFTPQEEGSSAIGFSAGMPSRELTAGEETSFTVQINYKDFTEEMPEIKTQTLTGFVEYVQEED